MNITNLEVLKGLVAKKSTDTAQLIQVMVTTTDIDSNAAELRWFNVQPNGSLDEPFASATLLYGDPIEWLASWVPINHLIQGRIQDLERLAESGIANRFTHNMAYLLFANNLVDYATKYRGMHSVVLHDMEAFADVVLSSEKGGTWTVPPFFIDSVAHLAGFVMNVSDAMDTKNNFCVTPGWRSMRFAKPLTAEAKYRSYVKMIPTTEDPSIYLGDVYILQDDVIIGMVGGIQFRRYPRILLSRFFSAPDDSGAPPVATSSASKPVIAKVEAPKPVAQQTLVPQPVVNGIKAAPFVNEIKTAPLVNGIKAAPLVNGVVAESLVNGVKEAAIEVDSNSTTAKAIQIIAKETELDLMDLTDDANFANLGIDSLMSLVIVEKFREQLGVTVAGSLFMEYPTIGDLRSWLEEYYN